MKEQEDFKKTKVSIRRLGVLLSSFLVLVCVFFIYIMADPTFSVFKNATEDEGVAAPEVIEEPDFDKIENGIHIRTGLAEGDGLQAVINHCTNCHSAKLVTQNRMTAEGWQATIQWMQETQNLWDLGKNEEIIVRYLATHYAPEKKGRRENLTNIEWYELE